MEFDWQRSSAVPDDAPDGLYMTADRFFVQLHLRGHVFSMRAYGPTKRDMQLLGKSLDMPAYVLRLDGRRLKPYRWERVA